MCCHGPSRAGSYLVNSGAWFCNLKCSHKINTHQFKYLPHANSVILRTYLFQTTVLMLIQLSCFTYLPRQTTVLILIQSSCFTYLPLSDYCTHANSVILHHVPTSTTRRRIDQNPQLTGDIDQLCTRASHKSVFKVPVM